MAPDQPAAGDSTVPDESGCSERVGTYLGRPVYCRLPRFMHEDGQLGHEFTASNDRRVEP